MNLNVPKNLKKLSLIGLACLSSSSAFAQELFIKGDGLSFQLGLGKAVNWQKLGINTANNTTIVKPLNTWEHETLAHIGVTYHCPIKNDYTFDAQLSWLLYPTLLDSSIVIVNTFDYQPIDPKILLLTPITDVGISKQINEELSVGAGITYLWGLYAKGAYKIDNNFSVFCHTRWRADRYLFNVGLHDSNVIMGLSYEI